MTMFEMSYDDSQRAPFLIHDQQLVAGSQYSVASSRCLLHQIQS